MGKIDRNTDVPILKSTEVRKILELKAITVLNKAKQQYFEQQTCCPTTDHEWHGLDCLISLK